MHDAVIEDGVAREGCIDLAARELTVSRGNGTAEDIAHNTIPPHARRILGDYLRMMAMWEDYGWLAAEDHGADMELTKDNYEELAEAISSAADKFHHAFAQVATDEIAPLLVEKMRQD